MLLNKSPGETSSNEIPTSGEVYTMDTACLNCMGYGDEVILNTHLLYCGLL